MFSKKYVLKLFIIIVLFMLTGGTCDQTRLTGEVHLADTPVKIGTIIPLWLEVPANLSEIYRVEWEVEPQANGEVVYGSQLLGNYTAEELATYFDTGEGINFDRVALFLPKKKGKCTIYVTGFYKQTNPQPVTALDLEIIE